MPSPALRIAENLAAVEERIAAACLRAGRARREVTLLAVVKYADWECVQALVELGMRDLAENRPQQLIERSMQLRSEPAGIDVRWHLIGHLQRNKVRPTLPAVHQIHSVDSLRLLQRIDAVAAELSLRPRVLLEVNVSGEAGKDGFAPDVLRRDWRQIAEVQHVELCGLMTMAPHCDDPAASRPTFAALRRLRDDLAARGDAGPLPELSMGMSGDFETAIEEGATWIRIGSRLFEGCPHTTAGR